MLKNLSNLNLSRYANFFQKFLTPQIVVAGLEFKDAAIRVAKFENDYLKKAAVMLEPGIIDAGKIKDKKKIVVALKKLKREFGAGDELTPVIAIIPSVNVYTKTFSTPLLSEESLEEAAILNLKTISPIEMAKGYSDWQQVSLKEEGGKIEILGAFAEGVAIDDYESALEEAGFSLMAVEFPALSIARTIKEYSVGLDINKPQVVVELASDGIEFMVMNNGELYFDYFVPWKLIQDKKNAREILFSDFKEIIIREVKRVSNFYGSHWGERLENLTLITQALNKEITELINQNFKFKVTELKLRGQTDLAASWFGVLGAAIRGKTKRRDDNYISLMKTSTEELSWQAETMFFIKLWRNALIATFSFIIILFIAADSFFANNLVDLLNQSQKFLKGAEGAEVATLQQKAREFNRLVDKVALADDQSEDTSPFFGKIVEITGSDIEIERLSLDHNFNSVFLIGIAKDESAALAFKNALIKEGFKDVSLPLSELSAELGGEVSFTITFKL